MVAVGPVSAGLFIDVVVLGGGAMEVDVAGVRVGGERFGETAGPPGGTVVGIAAGGMIGSGASLTAGAAVPRSVSTAFCAAARRWRSRQRTV